MLLRIPEIRANDRPGALEIDRLDGDHDHRAGWLAGNGEGGRRVFVFREMLPPRDPERIAGAGNEGEEGNLRIADDVAESSLLLASVTVTFLGTGGTYLWMRPTELAGAIILVVAGLLARIFLYLAMNRWMKPDWADRARYRARRNTICESPMTR